MNNQLREEKRAKLIYCKGCKLFSIFSIRYLNIVRLNWKPVILIREKRKGRDRERIRFVRNAISD